MNISWSARKLKPLLVRGGLILDVGSGGRPSPFAHVLLEKFPDDSTTHRFHSAKFDRVTIIGDAEKMPFKNNVFSFSVAYHVLEHVEDPEAMLRELGRTSRAGYIETPNTLHETVFPYPDHKWCLDLVDGKIMVSRKSCAELVEQYYHSIPHDQLVQMRKRRPELFHMQCHWEGAPQYEMRAVERSDRATDDEDHVLLDSKLEGAINRSGRQRFVNNLISAAANRLRTKNEVILQDLLCCVVCGSDVVEKKSHFACMNYDCGAEYKIDPFPNFNKPQ